MKTLRVADAVLILLLGSFWGLAGETLLFVRQQCRQMEFSLVEDFRVLGFLSAEMDSSKGLLIEERVRALSGVEEARFLSKESVLASLKERDPELIKSVSLLGENPLNPVVEIRLRPETMAGLPQWVQEAGKIPELADLRYKPMQVQAILRFQFYRRFVELALSLLMVPWFAVALIGLWLAIPQFSKRGGIELYSWRTLLAFCGAMAGMGALHAAILPLSAASWMVPPSLRSQIFLALCGCAGGAIGLGRIRSR